MQFLSREKAFSEDRVRKGIEKLKKNRQTSVQGRLTSFFSAKPGKATAARTPKKEKELSDEEPDFGIHKSEDENEDAEETVNLSELKLESPPSRNASAQKLTPKEEKKSHRAADPVVASVKPVKSWGEIFGKKSSSAPQLTIKEEPKVEIEEAPVAAERSTPKHTTKRKRILEDDDEDCDDDGMAVAAKKSKTKE